MRTGLTKQEKSSNEARYSLERYDVKKGGNGYGLFGQRKRFR